MLKVLGGWPLPAAKYPHNSVLTSPLPVGWRVDWEEWNLIGEGSRGGGGYKGSHLLPLTSRLIPCHALSSAHFVRCLPFLCCHIFFFYSQASSYIIQNTAFITAIFSSQLLACLQLNGCKEGAQQSEVRSDSLEATFNSSQNSSVLLTLFKHKSKTQSFDVLLDWITILSETVLYLLSVVNSVLECTYFSLGVKK